MGDLQKIMAAEALMGQQPQAVAPLSNEDILGALIQRSLPMRRLSINIEDRRNDPAGATRFETADPSVGDITFRPPFSSKVLPYNDPEGFANRARLSASPQVSGQPFYDAPILPQIGQKR